MNHYFKRIDIWSGASLYLGPEYSSLFIRNIWVTNGQALYNHSFI